MIATVAALALGVGLLNGVGDGISGLALHFQGEVEVRFSGGLSGGLLRPLAMLPPGTRLSLPPESSARVLCTNNSLVDLKGPRQWTVSAEECVGDPLKASLYTTLMASTAPISVTRSGEATLKTRAPHPRSLLWVLSPRGVSRQERPQLMWSAPLGAVYFQWTLSSGTSTLATKVVKDGALCREAAGDRSICRMDYPAILGALPAGNSINLKIAMLGSDLRPGGMTDESSFFLMAPQAAREVEVQLELLADAPLTQRASCLARSRVLETRGALGEAIALLLECPDGAGPPTFDRALARLYLTSDLARAALPHLAALAGRSSGPCDRAEVDLGFGRAYLLLGEHRRADVLLRASVPALETCGADTAHGRKWIEDNNQFLETR